MVLAILPAKIWALGLDEVALLDMSTTGKTVVLDRGLLENYTEGITAKFFVQIGELNFPKIFLVAEGRLVKSLPNKSYWFMKKVHLPKYVQNGGHLLILTTKAVNTGRPLKVHQSHIVLSPNQYDSVDDYLDKNTKNTPDHLLKDISKYEESDELFKEKKVVEGDLQISTYEALSKKPGKKFSESYGDDTEEHYFVGKREVKLADIKNVEDKKLLDSMSDGLLDKTNSEKYGLTNGLYKDQKKIPGSREFNDKITISSVYDDAKEEKKHKESVDPQALAKMNRDGMNWSADMDDTTLRRYFIRTGLLHEEKRRELVLNELDGNELMLHYSGALSDHSTPDDENNRAQGYNFVLGYDLHLSRTSVDLKNWSLQFFLEIGVSGYDVGGQNARAQEGYYGAYLNYYFYNNPLTLNSFIWLGGIGIKAGSVTMTSKTLSKEYNYQALTLPALQVMTKYRFRAGDLSEDTVNAGLSLNAGLMLDMKNLTAIDSLDDDINGKISTSDIKYLVGMSVYF